MTWKCMCQEVWQFSWRQFNLSTSPGLKMEPGLWYSESGIDLISVIVPRLIDCPFHLRCQRKILVLPINNYISMSLNLLDYLQVLKWIQKYCVSTLRRFQSLVLRQHAKPLKEPLDQASFFLFHIEESYFLLAFASLRWVSKILCILEYGYPC